MPKSIAVIMNRNPLIPKPCDCFANIFNSFTNIG